MCKINWNLKKSVIFLILACAFSVGIARVTALSQMQQQVAEKVIRFHVLAHSDKAIDQELKLAVRDQVGAYVGSQLVGVEDLNESRQIIYEQLDEIESRAREVLRENGCEYAVTASLENHYFPEKTYGKAVFPPGQYEALRVVIGDGKGRNWWCVLYPNMCFSGNLYQVDASTGTEELQKVLTPDEYKMIMESKDYEICFRFQELWESLKSM